MIPGLRAAIVRVLGQDQWPPGLVAQVTTVNWWGRDQGGTGMSTHTSPPAQQSPPYRPGQPPPRKRQRVFLWVFLGAVQPIFLAWVIYPGVTLPRSGPNNGLAIQIGLWALTDLILGTIYGICQARRSS